MKKKTPIKKAIEKIKEQMDVAIKNRDEATTQNERTFWSGVHEAFDTACFFLENQLEGEKTEWCNFAREGAIDFYHDTDPTERYSELYEVE